MNATFYQLTFLELTKIESFAQLCRPYTVYFALISCTCSGNCGLIGSDGRIPVVLFTWYHLHNLYDYSLY